MATATIVQTGWVVTNGEGRVVVIFTGAVAKAEAHEWAEQGYTVTRVKI
jgi:hypothetical protein